MIGAIDEAKKKTEPDKPEAKTKPGAEPESKNDSKTDADSKSGQKLRLESKDKPKPEIKHAADTHES